MSQFMGSCDVLQPNSLYIADEDRSNLNSPQYNFNYRMRRAQSDWEVGYYYSWPASRTCGGDTSGGGIMLGCDSSESGSWDTIPDYGFGGSIRPYFIKGQCLYPNGTPVTGVTVDGFITGNNLFVGSTTSDSNGNYSFPTIYTSNTHYLVAYMTGSPDIAGTTVNTLTPAATP